MANADRPNGFVPVGNSEKAREYTAASKIVSGEPVKLKSDGKVETISAQGDDILGIAMSLAKVDGDKVQVQIDPRVLYEAQMDESDFDAQTDVHQLVDTLIAAEDSTYDVSRMELDSSTIGSGAQWQIVELKRRTDNELGAQAKAVVRLNKPSYKPNASGV